MFKKILAALGLASVSVTPSAPATTRNDWVNKVAEDYAGVAAGVEINRVCSILSTDDGEKLEQELERFTTALAGEIHPEFMRLARQTSKELAADEPYKSCGEDARQAVADAQELVAWWLEELKDRAP